GCRHARMGNHIAAARLQLRSDSSGREPVSTVGSTAVAGRGLRRSGGDARARPRWRVRTLDGAHLRIARRSRGSVRDTRGISAALPPRAGHRCRVRGLAREGRARGRRRRGSRRGRPAGVGVAHRGRAAMSTALTETFPTMEVPAPPAGAPGYDKAWWGMLVVIATEATIFLV